MVFNALTSRHFMASSVQVGCITHQISNHYIEYKLCLAPQKLTHNFPGSQSSMFGNSDQILRQRRYQSFLTCPILLDFLKFR